MKILVIGDTHIPRRASEIPERIRQKIESERFDLILCTGDLTDRKILEYLNTISEVRVVRGNMDHLPFPEQEIIEIEGLKIGLIHGDQVYPRGDRRQLKEIGKKLGVDILVSGHTHSPDLHHDEILLLNPGSATGVWGGGGGSMKPSCMFLDIRGREVRATLLELEKELLSQEWKFKI
ncbi:MAG: YfcE family phosphodiesterase [Archaeoglobus sp.]|nr:YfcE family phosphodiesterase [Archaeoglobus sp.]